MQELRAGQARRLRARHASGLGPSCWRCTVNLMPLFGAFVGHYLQPWMNPSRRVLVAAGTRAWDRARRDQKLSTRSRKSRERFPDQTAAPKLGKDQALLIHVHLNRT